MGKTFAIFGVVAVIAFLSVVMAGISFHNKETVLRNTFDRKIDANTTDYDNMWKTISQVAQVPDKYKKDFSETFQGYVKARQGGNTGESELLSFLTEAVPEYDGKELYAKVQTVIEAKRESWTTRQKELVDVKLQHDNLITQLPGVLWATLLGRDALTLQLVTSGKTDDAFASGHDDDVKLYVD